MPAEREERLTRGRPSHAVSFVAFATCDDYLAVAMSSALESRLDPSLLNRRDREFLDRFAELAAEDERPFLSGREGVRIELPDAIFHHLVRVVRTMREGRAVVLFPERETLTSQAAANILGVSRPHLVSLLDAGEIPHHRAGTHRRVYLKDVLAYQRRRDQARRGTLDKLTDEIEAAGLYDAHDPAHAAR
jgi:excisionase family DNA binding protein